MPGSINSHYFHIIGDGKNQPNSRGLYTHYKDSVIKGGMTIPNIAIHRCTAKWSFGIGCFVRFFEQCEIFGRDWGVKKAI